MTTEQKHEIEIPGLPGRYRLVRVDIKQNDMYRIVVEKTKPRRIVLEETGEDTDPLLYQPIKIDGLCVLMVMHNKIWRVVEWE